jgi:dTDP-glucose pyrophosphorylase
VTYFPGDVEKLVIGRGATVRQAMTCIDTNVRAIALVVDDAGRLVDTVTDGDVRRGMLAGVKLDAPVADLLSRKPTGEAPRPVTAAVGIDRAGLINLMRERKVLQVPLLDAAGRVADLAHLDDLLPAAVLPLQAMVMAGGLGMRLRPLTDDVPKPMLPVGDRPLLERIIGRLRDAGIGHVSITTHYKPEKIIEHFGDGEAFGVTIDYVQEGSPLGTAGALGLMQPSDVPLLVINGDILTQADFRAMLAFHGEHEADLTVAVRQYDLQIAYGVVECDGPRVLRVTEKPVLNFFVNAGIYLLEPRVREFVRPGERLDMTDLVTRLLEAKRTVVSFPIREYWLDVGAHADYERAQREADGGLDR